MKTSFQYRYYTIPWLSARSIASAVIMLFSLLQTGDTATLDWPQAPPWPAAPSFFCSSFRQSRKNVRGKGRCFKNYAPPRFGIRVTFPGPTCTAGENMNLF